MQVFASFCSSPLTADAGSVGALPKLNFSSKNICPRYFSITSCSRSLYDTRAFIFRMAHYSSMAETGLEFFTDAFNPIYIPVLALTFEPAVLLWRRFYLFVSKEIILISHIYKGNIKVVMIVLLVRAGGLKGRSFGLGTFKDDA